MNDEFNKDLKKTGILKLKKQVWRAKEHPCFPSGMNHLTPPFINYRVSPHFPDRCLVAKR
jgi:hypothetical protein